MTIQEQASIPSESNSDVQGNENQSKEKNDLVKLKDKRLKKCENWYSRLFKEMKVDMAYAFKDQWERQTKDKLEIGDEIPALEFNELGTVIRWVVGSQILNRRNLSVAGQERGDLFTAEVLSDAVMREIRMNRAEHRLTDRFRMGVITSWAFMEADIDYNDIDDLQDILCGNIRLYSLLSNQVYIDPDFTEYDLSDAGYMFIIRKKDFEGCKQMFPDVEENDLKIAFNSAKGKKAIDLSTAADGEPDNQPTETQYQAGQGFHDDATEGDEGTTPGDEDEVDVVCMWDWEFKTRYIKVIPGNNGDKPEIDQLEGKPSKEEIQEIEGRDGRVIFQVMKVPQFSYFIGSWCIKYLTKSPFYPFCRRWPVINFFCELNPDATKSDLKHRGLVRDGVDPQYEINVRSVQGLKAVLEGANPYWDLEDDVFEGMDDEDSKWWEIKQKGQAPGFMFIHKSGTKGKKVYPENVGQIYMLLVRENEDRLPRCMGVNPHLQWGGDREDASGRALIVRERQSSTSNANMHDNLRLTQAIMGEVLIGLILKSYTPEKLVRVVGETKFKDYIDKNRKELDLDESDDPVMELAGRILSNVNVQKYDVTIDQVPSAPLMRMAWAEMLQSMTMTPNNPNGIIPVPVVADKIVLMSGIPDAENIAKKTKEFYAKQMAGQGAGGE